MKWFDFGFRFRRTATTLFLCLSLVLPCSATFTLDPTFGGGGKVLISFPDSSANYSSGALRVFVQPSGRIVVGGGFTRATPDGQLWGVAIVGLDSGGLTDPTFAPTLDWRSDASTNFRDAHFYADGSALRISQVFRLPVGSSTVRTVRTAANGAEDNVFTSNVSIAPCGGFCTSRPVQIAVRNDGKILALITDNGEYQLYRLNPDGTRDTTFGANGVVPVVFNKVASPSVAQMVALSDDKILMIGNDGLSSAPDFFLSRFTETGNRDRTFGRGGFVRMQFLPGWDGRLQGASVLPDGKILLWGGVLNPDSDVWMMRLRPNGRPDTTFGHNGVVTHDFDPIATDTALSAVVSADGKIRVAGQVGRDTGLRALVARFSASGALEDNISLEFTPGQAASASDIAFQPDGKLVVVGGTRNPDASINGGVFAIARLTE